MEADSVLQYTGFQRGNIPIHYLGVPLITSKLRAADCFPLIHRFCARIEAWTCRFLNFGGRLQLIKVVLSGIMGYWSLFLFLPKCVLKRLNALIFKFLWGGFYKADGRCHHKVNWVECCKTKIEGGLGIRNIFEWNDAAIFFQLWRIIQPRSSSIWVCWFRSCFLKNKPFWSCNLPYKCSWTSRKILNSRDKVRHLISYSIGANSSFLMWHDPWLRGKSVVEHFSEHIISHAASHRLATIADFQQGEVWSLPSSNFVDCIALRNTACNIRIVDVDKLYWDGLHPKHVSLTTIWHNIRASNTLSPWSDVVWFSFSIPKCSFICWLALKNRLLTKDRMVAFGMHVDPTCLLCLSDAESISHLFSTCPYYDLIRDSCPFNLQPDWSLCKGGDFFIDNLRGIERKMAGLYLTIAIYHTWKERNFRMHNVGKSHPTMITVRRIRDMWREKLFGSKLFTSKAARDNSLIAMLF